MEKWKKVWENLREFLRFLVWIWDCDCWFRFSVMIKIL
jgi:hypothetical protein